MVDKYKINLKKPPEPIQLKDATGPHELADERNYKYLDDLFKMEQLDPLADLDSDYVYQLMNKNAPKLKVGGQYVPSNYPSTYPTYIGALKNMQKITLSMALENFMKILIKGLNVRLGIKILLLYMILNGIAQRV